MNVQKCFTTVMLEVCVWTQLECSTVHVSLGFQGMELSVKTVRICKSSVPVVLFCCLFYNGQARGVVLSRQKVLNWWSWIHTKNHCCKDSCKRIHQTSTWWSCRQYLFAWWLLFQETLRGAWRDRDRSNIFGYCSLFFYCLDFKLSNFASPSELHPFVWFLQEKENIRNYPKRLNS